MAINRRMLQLLHLLELKQEASRKAYSELLKAREQFNQNKMRHDQLLGFRLDYLDQIETLGKEGTTIDKVKNRLNFIGHLDSALTQLANVLSQLVGVRTEAERRYKQAKIAEEAVVKLIERAKREEELKMIRKEQKESDEFAQKHWHGKKT